METMNERQEPRPEAPMPDLPDVSASLMHDWYAAVPGCEHGVNRICDRDIDLPHFRCLAVIRPLGKPQGRR